ncbi:MAG: methyltransferase domain-containing protein [Bacteroidota bacterium]|nr:methyltransferase domain-containing protein [Bacteroidota bacterium]
MFNTRSVEKEIMDDLEGGGQEMDQALRELETINLFLGGNNVSINGLKILLNDRNTKNKTIKIADIGCGGGDILKLLANWGRKRGYRFELIGIDANPHVVAYAKINTRQYPEIQYQMANIFSDEFRNQNFDIIHCCLFTHHFNNIELVDLLSNLKKQARLGIVINDLHRHWLAYYSIKVITTLASKSNMVKNDGPISVLRAFKKQELVKILDTAQLFKYSIKWKWAFRWQLVIVV